MLKEGKQGLLASFTQVQTSTMAHEAFPRFAAGLWVPSQQHNMVGSSQQHPSKGANIKPAQNPKINRGSDM